MLFAYILSKILNFISKKHAFVLSNHMAVANLNLPTSKYSYLYTLDLTRRTINCKCEVCLFIEKAVKES